MERTRAVIIGLGAWFILMGVASPVFADAFTNDDFGQFFFGVCFFIVFVLVGTVVLLVGISRSDRRHMQQQQQIVVMTQPAGAPTMAAAGAPQTRLRCPKCSALNLPTAKFCKQCGSRFAGGAR